MRVLFITWDGPNVNYLESLFLPIFKKLAARNIFFHVIQFNWHSKSEINRLGQLFKNNDIPYHSIKIWRKPISIGSFVSATFGSLTIAKKVKEWSIDIVMPRGILPGLSTLLAPKINDCKIIFDADGLPADERVEFSGESSSGLIYRFLRDIESELVRRSSVVLTRSNSANKILQSRAGPGNKLEKFLVVSNGRDSNIFKPISQDERVSLRSRLGIKLDDPLVIYVGSLGPKYRLDHMIKIFEKIHEINNSAVFLILTTNLDIAQESIKRSSTPFSSFIILTVHPENVCNYIAASDLGLAIIEQTFSMQAASAIKIGEYLLCGVPVITTKNVGNNSSLPSKISFAMEEISNNSIQSSADWYINNMNNLIDLRTFTRAYGLKHYSLDTTTAEYLQAFKILNASEI